MFLETPKRLVDVEIDGKAVRVPEGATLLEACRAEGIDTPTLCYLENLTPVNVCRVCVVEVEGSRTLVPACSRKAEPGMKVHTDSERVKTSGRWCWSSSPRRPTCRSPRPTCSAGSPSTALTRPGTARGRRTTRRGSGTRPGPASTTRSSPALGRHGRQPVKFDNEAYVRDYSRCILCYKCVEACGEDAQNTFAIAVAGRGFDARISTEYDVTLPDSACVYCGNCIGVCPTGALMPASEYNMRQAGTWDESAQTVTSTICPYCGVGCNLELHVQDNTIVKVTSPLDNEVTHGHLCVKGRFGFEFVQRRPRE